MKPAKELLRKYLEVHYTMQLATLSGAQPWLCTVYYVADEQFNLYWASLPTRRHSQEIEQNTRVACAINVRSTIGMPVIGIQIEGKAQLVDTPLSERVLVEKYAAKFMRDRQWVDDFAEGRTKHRLYKLIPKTIYLFDEENFPGGERQQIL